MKILFNHVVKKIVDKTPAEMADYVLNKLTQDKVVDISLCLRGNNEEKIEKIYGVKSFTVFHEDNFLNPEYLGTGCYDDPMTNVLSLAHATDKEIQDFLVKFFLKLPEESTVEVSVA